MGKRVSRGSRPLVILLLTLALSLLLLATAPGALAFPSWSHDGASCSTGTCHASGVAVPGTNAECQVCHTGFTFHAAATQDCWTCHQPGASMASSQQQAGCVGVCHFQTPDLSTYTVDATPHGTTPHYASTLKNCAVCHGVSVSISDPDGSPHHDAVDSVAPTSATCLDCHGTPPVDGATPAHGDLMTGITFTNCVHCHVGMDASHPAAATMVKPTLLATTAVSGADQMVFGTLKRGTAPVANASGWVQWMAPTDMDWSAANETAVTTDARGFFTATIAAPVLGTTYRVVFEGTQAGATIVRPALAAPTATPLKTTVTLSLSSSSIRLGKRVTIRGVVTPTRSGNVTVTIQRKKGTKWVKVTTKRDALSLTSAYSLTYKPGKRGTYRFQAKIGSAAGFTADTSPRRTLKVK